MFLNIFRLFKAGIVKQFAASDDEQYIDRKGIPPVPGQGEYPSYLCIVSHLKLELLIQFTASNDEKYF